MAVETYLDTHIFVEGFTFLCTIDASNLVALNLLGNILIGPFIINE
jgi:hypothetical protein